jgi:hypothetical protein
MKHFYFFIASTLFLAQPLIAQSEKQDFHETKWESAVEKFEAAEETKPVPQNAILFVGSSSIRLWNLEESFPDLVTINRGFGGSQLADSVQFVDRLVLKHKPRVIRGHHEEKPSRNDASLYRDQTKHRPLESGRQGSSHQRVDPFLLRNG